MTRDIAYVGYVMSHGKQTSERENKRQIISIPANGRVTTGIGLDDVVAFAQKGLCYLRVDFPAGATTDIPENEQTTKTDRTCAEHSTMTIVSSENELTLSVTVSGTARAALRRVLKFHKEKEIHIPVVSSIRIDLRYLTDFEDEALTMPTLGNKSRSRLKLLRLNEESVEALSNDVLAGALVKLRQSSERRRQVFAVDSAHQDDNPGEKGDWFGYPRDSVSHRVAYLEARVFIDGYDCGHDNRYCGRCTPNLVSKIESMEYQAREIIGAAMRHYAKGDMALYRHYFDEKANAWDDIVIDRYAAVLQLLYVGEFYYVCVMDFRCEQANRPNSGWTYPNDPPPRAVYICPQWYSLPEIDGVDSNHKAATIVHELLHFFGARDYPKIPLTLLKTRVVMLNTSHGLRNHAQKITRTYLLIPSPKMNSGHGARTSLYRLCSMVTAFGAALQQSEWDNTTCTWTDTGPRVLVAMV